MIEASVTIEGRADGLQKASHTSGSVATPALFVHSSLHGIPDEEQINFND